MNELILPEGITPYYQRDGITILHGDAREILPLLPTESVDLVLTDPPYPGLKGGLARGRTANVTVGTPWETALDWMPHAWRAARLGMMVFASYHSTPEVATALPSQSRVALVTWYKRNSPPAIANVPHFTSEFVWLFKKRPGLKWRAITDTVIDVPLPCAGVTADERIVDRWGKSIHPTQKPLALIRTLLAVGGDAVLDPFMGTGTTLVAARLEGRRCIGIELEERYCSLAVQRLQQSVLPLEVAS